MNLDSRVLIKYLIKKAKTSFLIVLLSFIVHGEMASQTFYVSGNVSTDSTAVKYASITFINANDWSKKYTTLSDSLGFYQLNIVTDVKNENSYLPKDFKLGQNYPNPFSENTNIPVNSTPNEDLQLKIYDILGSEVKTFSIGKDMMSKLKTIRWDGTNNVGNKVSHGVYICQLIGRNQSVARKILFLPGNSERYSAFQSSNTFFDKKNEVKENLKYEVLITNSKLTKPIVKPQKLNSLEISSDTTINFTMANKIDLGYYLYIANISGDKIYVVDTYTNSVVDSITGFDCCITSLVLTNNDSKMFVNTSFAFKPSKIYSVDLLARSVNLIKTIKNDSCGSYTSTFYKNPYDTVFIFTSRPCSNTKIFDIGVVNNSTDSIEYFDSIGIYISLDFQNQGLIFIKNSSVFYSVDTNYILFSYDYVKREVIRRFPQIYAPVHMILYNKILFIAGGPVFDFEKDSVVAWLGGNHLGTVALTSDNSKLYITDPGRYGNLDFQPAGKIYTYDTFLNDYSGSIDFMKFNYGQLWKVTDRIILVPNDKTAYVSDWAFNLYEVDLEINEVVQKIEFPNYAQIAPLIIGLKLEKGGNNETH